MFKTKRSLTISLITVICGAYLLQMISPSLQSQLYLFKGAAGSGGVAGGQWYRLFTVALTHGGLMHLGFNMIALHALGTPLEAVLGKTRYLVIFFISLFTGSYASTFLSPGDHISVGASGAIFGLFGAFVVLNKRIGQSSREIYMIIGLNFVLGFIFGGVDWRAHLGGLVGGFIATALISRITRLEFIPSVDGGCGQLLCCGNRSGGSAVIPNSTNLSRSDSTFRVKSTQVQSSLNPRSGLREQQ
jgi:membrane associated rhomboid family serine protease